MTLRDVQDGLMINIRASRSFGAEMRSLVPNIHVSRPHWLASLTAGLFFTFQKHQLKDVLKDGITRDRDAGLILAMLPPNGPLGRATGGEHPIRDVVVQLDPFYVQTLIDTDRDVRINGYGHVTILRDIPPSKFIRIYEYRSQARGISARHRVYFDAIYLNHRVVGVLTRKGSATKELISTKRATQGEARLFAQRCCLLGWTGPMIQCMNHEHGCAQPNPYGITCCCPCGAEFIFECPTTAQWFAPTHGLSIRCTADVLRIPQEPDKVASPAQIGKNMLYGRHHQSSSIRSIIQSKMKANTGWTMKWIRNSPVFFALTEDGLEKVESLCRYGNSMWFPRGK